MVYAKHLTFYVPSFDRQNNNIFQGYSIHLQKQHILQVLLKWVAVVDLIKLQRERL